MHIFITPKRVRIWKSLIILEGLKQQILREPLPLPKLKIAKKPIDQLKFEDFELIDYKYHDKIKFEVAV